MLFSLLFTALAFASPKTETYRYTHAGQTINMPTERSAKEKVVVNDICVKNEKSCEALKVFRGPAKIKSFTGDLPGNTAGTYCRHLGGTELFTKKGEEDFLFCVFPDLTAIDGRALYMQHAGGKK